MHGELKWFLLLFVGLWLAWIFTDGPERKQENRERPFIEQPVDGGETYTLEELKEREGR